MQLPVPLLVGLNAFQQRHVLNIVDALLAGSGKHKVLTAITRMLLVPMPIILRWRTFCGVAHGTPKPFAEPV